MLDIKKAIVVLTVAFTAILLSYGVKAQSLPVGTPLLEDYYRRQQMIGKVDSTLSFSIRPLLSGKQVNASDIFYLDSITDKMINAGPIVFGNGRGLLHILPLSVQQQFNSHHPYGWNDGPMIPAKGYQTMISGGIYLKYGPLSVQLRPEYVYATNPAFDGFASGHGDADLTRYYAFHNLVDWPERYGEIPYKKAFLGQSSIRLTFGAISMGVSNENLWWGPGVNNALAITNNPSGFKHLTLNTVRPVKTFLGDFEGQVVAGKLVNSGYPALLTTTTSNGIKLDSTKNISSRYFTGFNINYHPKWVPGFTFGLIRTFNAYYNDVKDGGFNAYIPFFTSYTKENVNGGIGDAFPRDQITTLYARWLFKKAQAEVYFEYGWEDNLYNTADLIQSPEHSRAYILGFRKMLPFKGRADQHILISTEVTQTSQHTERSIREVGLWYVNYQLLHGHTQDGQTLGAGTGTGGNIQSIDISWVSGLKKFGVGFDRYEHDVDFSEIYLPAINGNSRNWVDLAMSLNGSWNYKNLLFNAKLQTIKSLNYQWILKDYDPAKYYIPHNDVYNFHGEFGVTYRF
jgi:hypothetical protein